MMSARSSDSLPRVSAPQAATADPAVLLARLECVLDLLPLPLAIFDASHRLIRGNAEFFRLTGLTEAGAQGQDIHDAFPSALGDVADVIATALQGMSRTATVAFMNAGGPRVMEASFVPLADRVSAGGLVFVARDITEQARAGAQDARLRERRLAAVGQLAAGVMHDVNNALNPIVAAAYLLEVHADDPEAVRDYARRIAAAAETGAATAARVGRFIRQEPLQGGREELFDLDALADEVLAITRPVWAERMQSGGIEVVRHREGEPLVRGIAGEVREALLNLVQNALDAMPTGGVLTVATGARGVESWIEVRDNGRGMSAEVRERAFEPFFSTKGRKGTGLGLAEVYGVMKRHRGQADISSEEGKGTTVRLTFPRAAAVDTPQSAPARRPAPLRVLIVEDHEDGREFMRALLASDGHTVAVAASVAEAMDQLRSASRPFDVVVTDIGLPDGNGWDLVRNVRATSAETRVGVVTGWEPAGEPPLPVDFTLRKPVPAQALLRLVAGEQVAA